MTRWAIRTTEKYFNTHNKYIIDFYCPRILENIIVNASLKKSYWEIYINDKYETDLIKRALQIGVGFMVANSRQRDWLLGLMTLDGLFVRRKHLRDAPSSFVAIVPMTFYMKQKPSYVDARRYISQLINYDIERKFLLVWSGGWHEWMDIKTVVSAMKIIAEKNSDIILVMGAINNSKQKNTQSWKDGLEELQKNKKIFVLETWIPFGDHVNLVRAANISLVLAGHHIEDHISYRTRAIESIENNVTVVINKENPLLDESHDDVFGVTAGSPVEVASCILRLAEASDRSGPAPRLPERTDPHMEGSAYLYNIIECVKTVTTINLSKRKIVKGLIIDFMRRLTRVYTLVMNA